MQSTTEWMRQAIAKAIDAIQNDGEFDSRKPPYSVVVKGDSVRISMPDYCENLRHRIRGHLDEIRPSFKEGSLDEKEERGTVIFVFAVTPSS